MNVRLSLVKKGIFTIIVTQKNTAMRYYEVQVWNAQGQGWLPVNDIEYVEDKPVIRFGSPGQLSYAEAKSLHSDLSETHKQFRFQIVQINTPYRNA